MESSEIEQFGRSCLPGRTSRLAATSVHVNRQYRLAVSLARRTRFACGESPFRQKGPTLTTIRDYTQILPLRLPDLTNQQRAEDFFQCIFDAQSHAHGRPDEFSDIGFSTCGVYSMENKDVDEKSKCVGAADSGRAVSGSQLQVIGAVVCDAAAIHELCVDHCHL